MKRLFIAINLPEKIKKDISTLQKEIENLFPEELRRGLLKWVEEKNLHLTLNFLGGTKEEKVAEVINILETVFQGINCFELNFKKLTYGPAYAKASAGKPTGSALPRLIWIELEKNIILLKATEILKKELEKAGFLKSGERGFSPHITLARIRTWQWKRIPPEERPDIERELDLNFKVGSIELMESALKRTGPEYKILKSCNLKLEA